MIAVDGLDGGEFSVWWQSPISGVLRGSTARDAGFLVVLCAWCELRRACRLGYVQFALAVVGVDDSNGGDEEVISTWQVRSTG
jgi:hypothetical protein